MTAGSCPRVLLVEGADDEHVVRHLRHRGTGMPEFDILGKGGFDALSRSIGPEIKAPGRIAVGVLADANDDWRARWRAIADRLRSAGIEPPDVLDPAGAVMEGRPRAGVWLMPDNRSEGELENFVEKLIPADDPVWPLAGNYIDGIPDHARKFQPGKSLRARIHAWLAARAEPRKMGAAIGAGDLDAAKPLATTFNSWLRSVFG